MKPSLVFVITLLFAPLASRADAPAAKTPPPVPKEFVSIVDKPTLPRVLLMGDSDSVACALEVRGAR